MAFEIQEISISMAVGDAARPPRPEGGEPAAVDVEAIVAQCIRAIREELKAQNRKDWKER